VFGLGLSLGVVIGLAWDFPTWSEWIFTPGAGRVGIAFHL